MAEIIRRVSLALDDQCCRQSTWIFLSLLDLVISIGVIHLVGYTEIDWRAYMQEVEGVLIHDEWDYVNLRGDTGPLVYPAGFVWVFMALRQATDEGKNIRRAQYIFALVHALIVYLVAGIVFYKKEAPIRGASREQRGNSKKEAIESDSKRFEIVKFPPFWVAVLLVLSRRVHSIFVLRLFNDGVAMLFMYACIYFLIRKRMVLSCALFSAALSMKMNIILFIPGLAVILLQERGLLYSLVFFISTFISQVLVAIPFLRVNPMGYLSRAFELSRVFMHKWTVNLKFLPEPVFVSKELSMVMLVCTVCVWLLFGHYTFSRYSHERGGLIALLADSIRNPTRSWASQSCRLMPQHMVFCLFASNFIGIVFARSIHYQFYCWYYHTLGFLVYCSALNTFVGFLVIGLIELSYNIYPATPFSSAVLQFAHFTLLLALISPRIEAYRQSRQKHFHIE